MKIEEVFQGEIEEQKRLSRRCVYAFCVCVCENLRKVPPNFIIGVAVAAVL